MSLFPTTIISNRISLGSNVKSVNIRVYFTGSLSFEITNNSGDASPTWSPVTLTSGVMTTFTFTTTGDSVQYRIIGMSGLS